VSAQVDSQLRERRKAFKRRRETLEKIQSAAGELELRIDEIEAQDRRLVQFQTRTSELAEALREHAFAAPMATDMPMPLDIPLFDDAVPVGEDEVAMQRQA
jgi:DNA repair ATPase RecN